jgi:hypothetical protein
MVWSPRKVGRRTATFECASVKNHYMSPVIQTEFGSDKGRLLDRDRPFRVSIVVILLRTRRCTGVMAGSRRRILLL